MIALFAIIEVLLSLWQSFVRSNATAFLFRLEDVLFGVSKWNNFLFKPFHNRIVKFIYLDFVHVVKQRSLLKVRMDVAHAVWDLGTVVRLLRVIFVAVVDMHCGHSLIVNVKDFVLLSISKVIQSDKSEQI